MRLLVRSIALAMAVLSMLAIAQAAQADTDTDATNPELVVTASLLNRGGGFDADEDTARAGELVTAAASVQNTTGRRQVVRIALTLTAQGAEPVEIRYPYIIGAGRTASVSLTFPILRFVPQGDYSLGVAAANASGTSSAEAMIRIVQ
jgi:hypothetical protein